MSEAPGKDFICPHCGVHSLHLFETGHFGFHTVEVWLQWSVAIGLLVFVGSWVGYSVGYHDGWHRYKLRVPILYRWLRTPEIEQHIREEEDR